jgi:Na+/citrate or Na+/malate symporter
LNIDLREIPLIINLKDIIFVILIVSCGVISSFIFSRFFKFYPLEGAISTSLSTSSMGGIGALSVAEVSERENLIPYGQISARFIGTFLLIV